MQISIPFLFDFSCLICEFYSIHPWSLCVLFVSFTLCILNHFSLCYSSFFLPSPVWFTFKTPCTHTHTDAIDDDEFSTRTPTIAAETVEAIENKSIVLSCGRTKMPDSDVKWFFNGKYFLYAFFASFLHFCSSCVDALFFPLLPIVLVSAVCINICVSVNIISRSPCSLTRSRSLSLILLFVHISISGNVRMRFQVDSIIILWS